MESETTATTHHYCPSDRSENSLTVTVTAKVDGAFCIPCALFSSGRIKGQLVTQPFQTWQKILRSVESMSSVGITGGASDYSIEHPELSISALASRRTSANIEKIQAVLNPFPGQFCFVEGRV